MESLFGLVKMPHPDLKVTASEFLHSCLKGVRANLPAVDRVLTRYGRLSLIEYLSHFPAAPEPSLQSREPLLDIVHRYAEPLLGAAVTRRAVDALAARPLVLTTNHHGVDYYAQTVQSRLILSLASLRGGFADATIMVFACGNVPLNNLTYPRGLLFYRPAAGERVTVPFRLPLFPDRLKRTMVNAAPAWDGAILDQADARLDELTRRGSLAPEVARTARSVLEEDYRSVAKPILSSYAEQAVAVNRLVWKRLFAGEPKPPEMLYLELERIASELLCQDLADPQSLAWGVLFDAVLRERVLAALDGIRGCWHRTALGRRFHAMLGERMATGTEGPCGTVFFWGRDLAGRRIPLDLHTTNSGTIRLRGRDDAGKTTEIPWSPPQLADLLETRRLFPSLFTSFLVLAFARGVSCIGGYLQGEYLPAMQRGLAAALQGTAGYGDAARAVLQVPTKLYLDGMAVVMSRIAVGGLIPAGPLEIIAAGGLTPDDLASMGSLTVTEAHLADLSETFPDVTPPLARMVGWQQHVARACSQLLERKVVVK